MIIRNSPNSHWYSGVLFTIHVTSEVIQKLVIYVGTRRLHIWYLAIKWTEQVSLYSYVCVRTKYSLLFVFCYCRCFCVVCFINCSSVVWLSKILVWLTRCNSYLESSSLQSIQLVYVDVGVFDHVIFMWKRQQYPEEFQFLYCLTDFFGSTCNTIFENTKPANVQRYHPQTYISICFRQEQDVH